MQNFTLHTHTVGFDGHQTPAEMIAHAKSIGMHKNIGLGRDASWAQTENSVISRLAAAGAKIEINTGAYQYYDEPYPSRRILERVASHDIPVVISDDAHDINQIGRHFERAENFARDCGVKNFMTLQKILDFSC